MRQDPTVFIRDPAREKPIRDGFVERVSTFDRQAAMHLDLAFDLHDPRSLFVNVVTFFSLGADNVTDPVTAVLAVAWVAANRADDPSVAQVQALGCNAAARSQE